MNKNTLFGFILGGVVVFSAASVALMTPMNMWVWVNSPLSSNDKVVRALGSAESQQITFDARLAELEEELSNEKIAFANSALDHKLITEELRREIKSLKAKSRNGKQDLSAIFAQMEKEINFLSGKLLGVELKDVTTVEELRAQKKSFQEKIASMNVLLSETEEKLSAATYIAKKAKEREERNKLEVEFAKTQLSEQVASNGAGVTRGGSLYDTSLLIGERKLFRNQAKIYFGGKLSLDLRRIDVGNYCDVRIRSFIDENESKTINLKMGEPVKVTMAQEDFIVHYFYSYERPIPTCVFNVYEM